ncbi:endonuclease [Bacillus phage G]|uniref:Gp511 n=1 Tax=Bacillus phage G TaxID=2884420 RepID=G3MAQ2_9CAUD|nr:endonuclease [Bacillus phage G]AEO93769.1 gp511 [Bacillus phage G]
MKFGYACINISTNMRFRTCRLKTAQVEGLSKIKELTLQNLNLILDNIVWNIENNIYFYRFTSNVIPFATHDIMKNEFQWDWYNDKDILEITSRIRDIVLNNNLRLTVHPGQYSPLNTPNEKTLKGTFDDFEYHDKMLELMGGTDMITHVGGMYGDKEMAKINFINNYFNLSDSIKQKLRLENDDKIFTVEDVLEISSVCGVPVCLDIHHHNCNPSDKSIEELFPKVVDTWRGIDIPKTHISSGKTHKLDRAHADYINREDLESFLRIIGDYDVDIMFESKKKDLSVLQHLDLQRL